MQGPRGGWLRALLAVAPGRQSGASEAALGATKEVLVIIDFLVFNYDFLGFPSIVLGFIIDFLGFLSGFYYRF